MKKIVFVFLAFSLILSVSIWATELNIKLENPVSTGTVYFIFFDDANAFGDLRDPFWVEKLPIDQRESYTFSDLPEGEYALLVYHDKNDNEQIDKNFIGIPTEALGFSNNYQPKGPPSYSRAAFTLESGIPQHFDVTLEKPLGDLGRLGVGLAMLVRSSPYKGYNGGVYQAIPSLSYTGARLQMYGPNAQVGVWGKGKVRLAVNGSYRMGVYKEDDSDALAGMGDRKGTFMAGLSLQAELPGGVNIKGSYLHDVIDTIGDGEARVGLNKSFQFGWVRLSPSVQLNLTGEKLANYDFGVSASQATLARPQYEVGPTVTAELGTGLSLELSEDWLIILNGGVEFFGDDITDSPIVDKPYVLKGFGAITYIF